MENVEIIKLPAECIIQNADDIADCFRKAITTKGDVILDVSSTDIITTAIIQLILALDNHLIAHNNKLIIQGARDVFINNFSEIGLENFLSKKIIQQESGV